MLDGKRVDAAEIDPEKHTYTGMWRSPTMLLDEDSEKHGYIVGPGGIHAYCPTCRVSYSAVLPHMHMLQGCWDMPSYVTAPP